MTDKEILDRVYDELLVAREIGGWTSLAAEYQLMPPNAVEKKIEESIKLIEAHKRQVSLATVVLKNLKKSEEE